jgi:Notch-like protein
MGHKKKNPQILADTFNDYFSKVVDESIYNISKQDLNQTKQLSYLVYLVKEFQQPFPSIKFKPVTEKEIYLINRSLKWRNSCGYDEVPSKMVKLTMQFISSLLIHICNRMLVTGTFPTRLKFSQILPVFKKGNRVEISAYRPVSLLTSFSKIFEKFIYNRLLQHTKGNNIINSDQYGLKK